MNTKAKVRKTFVRHRPERSLREMTAEAKNESKSVKGISKQFTAVQKAEGDGSGSATGSASGIFIPTAEQMEAINRFTQSPKAPEDVVCFSTLSCNDVIDRDLDRFTSECVGDFAKLPEPFSPVGKGYMVSHDYTKLPVGTVFEADTVEIEGVTHLTNSVFMPNTDQYKNFIENIDFGIYRFVSVGVMLSDTACSVCQSPMYESRFFGNFCWCSDNGHEKGLWYDPDDDERDEWGWAYPVEEGTKGAVQCTRDLFNPLDFYELSQVFLGAQYGAQLVRGATKGLVKAVASAKVPLLGISAKEAADLPVPIPHVDPRVREAYARGFKILSRDASNVQWVDGENVVWTFDAEEDEVLCLGEFNDKSEGGDEDGEEQREQDGSGGGQSEESDDGSASGSSGEDGDEDGDGPSDEDELLGEDAVDPSDAEDVGDDDIDSDEEDTDSDDDEDDSDDEDADEESGEDLDDTDKSVLSAVTKAKLPDQVVRAVKAAKGGQALKALLSASSKLFAERDAEIKELQPKAKLGERYVKAKRAEALKWYVTNRQAGQQKGVKTDTFERMLDRLGDDIDLLDEVIDEQKGMAQAKFPATARRSAVPVDPHEAPDMQPLPLDKETADKARKLHG